MIGTVRVVNMREPRGIHDHYIGRPSALGNPYPMREENLRGYIINLYRKWLTEHLMTKPNGLAAKVIADLVAEVRAGHTVTLRCYCAPKPCHGDVIAEVVMRLARFECLACGGDPYFQPCKACGKDGR